MHSTLLAVMLSLSVAATWLHGAANGAAACEWSSSSSECNCAHDPPPYVGEGYNTFVGFPISYNFQCYDPGFTSSQILNFTTTGCSQQGVNECSFAGQAQTFYSQSGYTSTAGGSVGVGAGGNFQASIAWSTLSSNDASDSSAFQSASTSCLYSSARTGTTDMQDWTVTNSFYRAVSTMATASSPLAAADLANFINAWGLYYVREVSGYGGLTTYVSITSATNVYAQQSSTLNMGATAATTSMQANTSLTYNQSAFQQTAQDSTFFQGCFAPATVNPLPSYNTTGLSPEAASTWQNALIAAANKSGTAIPIFYSMSPTTDLFNCSNVNCTLMWRELSQSQLSSFSQALLDFAAGTGDYAGNGYCDQDGVTCVPSSSQCADNSYNAAPPGQPADCQSCAPAGCNWKGTATCTNSTCTCTSSYVGSQCQTYWYGTCEGVKSGSECVVGSSSCTNPENPTAWAQYDSSAAMCVCQCQSGSGSNGAGGCCGTDCCGSGCTPHGSSAFCGSQKDGGPTTPPSP